MFLHCEQIQEAQRYHRPAGCAHDGAIKSLIDGLLLLMWAAAISKKQKKRPSKIAIQPGHVWTEEVRRRVYVLKQGRRKDRTDHLSWVVKQESIGAV